MAKLSEILTLAAQIWDLTRETC